MEVKAFSVLYCSVNISAFSAVIVHGCALFTYVCISYKITMCVYQLSGDDFPVDPRSVYLAGGEGRNN